MLIPVKIVDISLSNLGFVVFLKHTKEERTLPIFIGVPEAQAIAVQFNKMKTPRPLTHDLLKNILTLLDCNISKIVVNDLIDNTFYAKIFLETKQERFQVDSRPSDAIALALRFEIPIYVEDSVMDVGAVKSKNDQGPEKVVSKSQLDVLKDRLQSAIADERYEEAAQLRDDIKKQSGQQN